MRRYDYRPSPPDARGTHEFCRAGSTPQSADNSALIIEVWNQLDEGSCTGHGLGQAFRGALVHAGLPSPAPSRQALYWLGKLWDGDPAADDGSTPSSILAAAAKLGVPPESAWPYVEGDLTPGDRLWRVVRAAADQRWVSGYARITSTGSERIADLKAALAAGHLVAFGTDVDQAFEDLTPTESWPGVKGPVLGGHCVCGVSYSPRGLKFVNSWSYEWCDQGFGWMAWSAIAGLDDLWIISAAPSFTRTV